jgi:hypothetical protein
MLKITTIHTKNYIYPVGEMGYEMGDMRYEMGDGRATTN